MLILVTTGIAIEAAGATTDVVAVAVLVHAVSCGNEVTTESFSLGTLIVSFGIVEGEFMTELGADDEDEMGDDSSELILVSLEQLSSEVAAGFGGIGLMVNLGIGTSDGSRGMAGGGLGIGLIVSFGIVDVMLEFCWSLGDANCGGVTNLGEKLLLVEETNEASCESKELVLMVSFGNGGSGIGLMVNLTPSELVKTGQLGTPALSEIGTTVGSGFALMCSFGIAGGFEDDEDEESSSLAANRLLMCE